MTESNPNTEPPERREPVLVTWDPECPAVCVTPGEQVSEVRFADGRERFLPNRELEPKSKIGPKRWARIMSELPTDSARELFVKMFGSPECVPAVSRSAQRPSVQPRTGATSAPSTTPTPRPASRPEHSRSPAVTATTSTDGATLPASAPRSRASAPRGKSDVWDRMAAFMATPRTMEEIAAEFGWLKHSASARVSGLKKVRNVVIRDGRYSVTA